MNEHLLDRELRDLFAAGPHAAPADMVNDSIATARLERQRRPRFARLDPRSWPPTRRSMADPSLRRSARFALVAVTVLVLAAAVIVIGSRLLDDRPVPAELVRAGRLESLITGPRATLLPDGRVLIWGQGPETIFDPLTGEISPANLGPFANPAVTALPDGRMFVVGPVGSNQGGPDAVGTFDPSTGRTTFIAELAPLFAEANTMLDDGRLLSTGGAVVSSGFELQSIVRLFDPVSGTITALDPLLQPRSMHSAIALEGGRVLIVGGGGIQGAVTDVEVYDVTRGASTSVGSIAPAREITAGPPIALADGRILIPVGFVDIEPCGETFLGRQATWIFDPRSDRLTPGPTLPHPVEQAVALQDGRFVIFGVRSFIAGGCESGARPELRPWLGVTDPATGVTLQTLDGMTGLRTLAIEVDVNYGAGVLLPDGRVALIADDFENNTNNAIDNLTVGR